MPDSSRMIFEIEGGLNTVTSSDLLKPGSYAYLQNTRKLLGGRITARPPIGATLIGGALSTGVTSVVLLNDPYLGAPGYAFIEGTAGGSLCINTDSSATGLSGNPLSFLPYRPAATPRPWCYVADPSLAVTVPAYISSGYGTMAGMLKVRADGVVWKTGIKEPQVAAAVTSPGGGPNSIVYRYTYRASSIGAESNPSPESYPIYNGASDQDEHAAPSTSDQWEINTGQWQVASLVWRTIDSWVAPLLLDPIYTLNMGFSVPSGATVTGVVFNLQWQNQAGGAAGTLVNCQLWYQGQLIGTQKLPNIQSVGFPSNNNIGSYGDTWGAALSPTIVNDPSFGVEFQIYQGAYNGTSQRLFIDGVDITVYWSVANSGLTPTASLDPQVDVNDWWRMGGALENFTYVGTSPNGVAFTDTLSDAAAALNPILQFDNYEPFPSIDLPRSGICNVISASLPNQPGATEIQWVSGDHFNVRWLPGTIVLVAGVAYVLYNRPPSTTVMYAYTTTVSEDTITFAWPPLATGVTFSIAQPDLANEPSPVIWGPTPDNAGSFYFGLDPLNPGDLVWSMGNNFDSAPDTNRMPVTSPSESLMNGTVTSELSTVFSTERFWLIYPNFSDAVAAVTGTLGQQWVLVQAASTRGLFMRYAIAALANMIAWRAKDGIFLSHGGGPEQEISKQIYNLFPHGEPQAPQTVLIGENAVYPPDDTKPKAQTMAFIPGYIFYDYQDTNGNPRTLVYDMEAKGWSVDVTNPVANCHALPVADNQILLGCVDGTVRAFDSGGTEEGSAIAATPSVNGGSARKVKRIGGVFLRALAPSVITPQFWKNRYFTQIIDFAPPTIGGSVANETDYLTDFTNCPAGEADVLDLAAVFSFPLGSGDWLKEWQPDWTELPEQIVAWRTGMLSYGLQGWMHAPWLRFAYQSEFGLTLTLVTDQLQTITLPVPASPTQPSKYFTWLPPNKFKLMEWQVDGGANPFTVYGKDCEIAVGQWGRSSGYSILRPIRQQDGSTT